MQVIKVENLSKEYRLGVIGHGTLTHDLQSWWARLRKKEDPNLSLDTLSDEKKKQTQGNRFLALHDINFSVEQGQVVGIIGKNGAGKSTLLKILSRVTAPTTGIVKVKGRIASLLEVGTGFHPELTGRENIFMNGSILGMNIPEIKSKLDEIVDFSGVGRHIDTPVKRYSSGMTVRLAFAVAAHLEPEILIVDEVLAVGDIDFQKKAIGKMKDVSQEGGRTVLFVSHNMNSINALCSTGILLKRGEIVKRGSIGEVIDEYVRKGVEQTGMLDLEDQAVAESLDRSGKRFFLELRKVRIENSKGEITNHVSMGESLSVILQLQVKQPVHNPEVGACISTPQGTRLKHYVSKWERDLGEFEPGSHQVRVTIDPVMLYPGTYSLTVWVRYPETAQVDDFVEAALELNVAQSNLVAADVSFRRVAQSGGVYQPSTWERL